MMNYAIETLHLKKVYKDKIVVNDVNIHVKKGDIYGFVGPNGAGKSTLMKMLLNLVQANSGEIVIFGNKVIESDFEILKRIGSIIENPYFYEKLTARENLDLHCEYMGYHNKNHIKEVLECVGLLKDADKKISQYSLGMKQRLAIARAILTKPELLILDEPINGLDPQGIIEMRELILKLNHEQQITVFISSHILDELSKLATHYGFIDNGCIVKEISSEELQMACRKCIHIKVSNTKALAQILDQMKLEYKILSETEADIYAKVQVSQLALALDKVNCTIVSMQENDENLESYYIELIGGHKNV